MSEEPRPDANRFSTGTVRACAFAAAWGFAETTFFFIVPDVLLSRIALRDWRRAFIAAAAASIAAAAGGALLWTLAHNGYADRLLSGMLLPPGINPRLVDSARQLLSERGTAGLFAGMMRGQPYKIFAVHAGAAGLSLGRFFLVSLVARYARFAATTAVAAIAGRLLRSRTETFSNRLHVAVWVVFYTCYFAVMW